MGKFGDLNAKQRELLLKILAAVIVICMALLTFDVFSSSNDGRRQIVDNDGGTETALCRILSDIKGAGAIDVMIQYTEENTVSGVIVTSTGAGNLVVRNNLTNAVATVFDIPVSNVMVFEKEIGGNDDNPK